MEQTEEVEEYQDYYAQINQYERKIEAGNMKTKECEKHKHKAKKCQRYGK